MVSALIADLNNYGSYTITDQALPQQVCDILFQAQDSVAIGSMTPAGAAKFMQDGIDAYKAAQR
jgi:raffinose/stachyose/melibiose transport system substrate-binding protein